MRLLALDDDEDVFTFGSVERYPEGKRCLLLPVIAGAVDCNEWVFFMRALLDVILFALNIYIYVVIAMAIFSWLLAFNVINFHNEIVRGIWNFLIAVTEPVLRPIRSFLPNLGGIDISPIILFLVIMLIQNIIIRYIYPNVF